MFEDFLSTGRLNSKSGVGISKLHPGGETSFSVLSPFHYKKYRWFLFFPLFLQLIKHFQLDAHFVEEAGESAMDQVDQVDQVVDLGSEEEETGLNEGQVSGGADEDGW